MTGGAFSPAARDAILNASGDRRCAGCGNPQVTTQHRRARGMGGTRRDELGQAVNGVPLCGDGVRGCHGWAESLPVVAGLLGWRLSVLEDPLVEPFWTRLLGWRRWVLDDGVPLTVSVFEDELDSPDARSIAVEQLRRHLANR